VRIGNAAVQLEDAGIDLQRPSIRRWTHVSGVASLYCANGSYKLRPRPEDEAALEAALRHLLGSPASIEQRGSRATRSIALTGALLGLASAVTAFLTNNIALVVFGLPAFIFGIATFAVLSQRITRNP
jgi:hypothetical protein